MSELEGLDGQAIAGPEGLTFRRSKLRTVGRGVGTEHTVPWDQVVMAGLSGGRTGERALVVKVAGIDSPKSAEQDPHAVVLKRGQADEARGFVGELNTRAAGREPDPVAAPPTPTPTRVVIRHAGGGDETARFYGRMLQIANISYFLMLLPIILGALVFLGLVIWFLAIR